MNVSTWCSGTPTENATVHRTSYKLNTKNESSGALDTNRPLQIAPVTSVSANKNHCVGGIPEGGNNVIMKDSPYPGIHGNGGRKSSAIMSR
jgi:hypothetical protein